MTPLEAIRATKAWCERVPESPTEALWRVTLCIACLLWLHLTFTVILPWLGGQL